MKKRMLHNLKSYRNYYQSGFTLVELGIILLILGIIVTAIAGTDRMIKSSTRQKMLTELHSYETAINTFKTEFGYLPGDFPRATNYFSGTTDGDGNNRIEDTSIDEHVTIWEQLFLADMIKCNCNGTDGGKMQVNVNVPEANVGEMLGIWFQYQTLHSRAFNYLGILKELASPAVWLDNSSMRLLDAYNIDLKVDDGLPKTGFYVTVGDANCASGSNTYVLSAATTSNCGLYKLYNN